MCHCRCDDNWVACRETFSDLVDLGVDVLVDSGTGGRAANSGVELVSIVLDGIRDVATRNLLSIKKLASRPTLFVDPLVSKFWTLIRAKKYHACGKVRDASSNFCLSPGPNTNDWCTR